MDKKENIKFANKGFGLKIIAITLCVALFAFLSGVISQPSDTFAANQPSYEGDMKLVNKGKLTIANSPDYPPFAELSGDEIVGFEPDVWQEIAKRLGLEVEVKILNFDAILTAVASGTQVDVGIAGISIDPEREQTVDFTNSYYTADISFAVDEGSALNRTNAKHKLYDSSLRFAVQSGTTAEIYVRENFPKATCLAYTNANDCFSAVTAGQADVVCSQTAVVTSMLKNSYSTMQIVQNVATGEEYAIAVAKDNPALKDAINKVIDDMNADGTMQKLAAKSGLSTADSLEVTTLQTAKCTAKTNSLAANDVLTDKETRITWEGQAAKDETVTGLQFNMPEGTSFNPEEIVVTMLTGEDLLNRTVMDKTIVSSGQNIDIQFTNKSQLKSGAYYRVEFYEVMFSEGGELTLGGNYNLANSQVLPITDIPALSVVKQSPYEKFAEDLNEQPAIQAWNSNKFCNLFLNPSIFLLSIPSVFWGFLMALATVLCAFPLALPVGLLFALMRISKLKVLRGIATTYVNIVRGTPLFLQIYIAFFGLPLAGVNIPNFPLGLIVLAINSSAYMCEIFRAGIQSISKGQFEAARSIGLTRGKAMWYVILPQTISRCIPTLTSEFILLYKDTSLLASVGVMEVVMFAKTIVASTGSITPYIVAALFYLAITIPLAKFVGNLEGWFNKGRKATKQMRVQNKHKGIDKSVDKGQKVFPPSIKGSSKTSGDGVHPNQMGSF